MAAAAAQRRAAVAGSIDAQSAHLTTVAALGILLVLLGLLGGSKMPGWRPVSWIAAGLASVFALQSLLFPATLSSLGAGWAVATLAWAAAFVVVAEWRARGR